MNTSIFNADYSRNLLSARLAGFVMAELMLLLFGVRSSLADETRPVRPPNIILFLVDDLGWADLGCYGADLHETPNIDRLAKSGVRFTNAYASAPICSPTRAALLTGLYPARLHMTIWREAARRPVTDRKLIPPPVEENLPAQVPTLSSSLNRVAYLTAHIGKWHLGDSTATPKEFGFAEHLAGNHFGAPATYFFPYKGEFGRDKEIREVPGLSRGREGEYLTDRLTEEAVEFIKRAGEAPFFLNLWHYGVHTPLQAKKEDVDYFAGKIKPTMKHQNATYAAMLRSVDQSVCRITQTLRARGLAEDTIFIFTSDNGGFLGDASRPVTNNAPLRSGKGALYEGGIRVPLIIVWPGVTTAGTVSQDLVASMDLFPTLMDCFLLMEPKKLSEDELEERRNLIQSEYIQKNWKPDGITLLPILKDPRERLVRDTLYWHYPHYYPTSTPCSAIRKGDLKLIEFFEDNHVELYNLRADPSETSDLAAKMPADAKALHDALAKWRESVGAQMPTRNPAYKAK